jgi:hypothetical protein
MCAGEGYDWANDEDYLKEFTGDNFYREVNNLLWDQSSNLSHRLKSYVRGLAYHIYMEFESDLPDVLTVYRGVELSSSQLAMYTKGALVYWHAFSSTSKSLEVVDKHFARNTLFVIHMHRGRRLCMATLRDRTFYKNEMEVLISANVGFRVRRVLKVDKLVRAKYGVTSSKFKVLIELDMEDEKYAIPSRTLCEDHQS